MESDKGKPPRPKASGGRDRSELDAMRDHIQKCEATIRDLESQLQRADDDFTRIEVSVREGERVRKDAIARANALETVLAEASAELEAEQQRAADLSGQLSDSQLSCESLQWKCDSLNDELLRVKAQFSAGDVDRTIRDLHDQLAKQSKQSAALQSEMGTALIRLRECDPDRVPSTSHLVPTVVDAVVSLVRDLRSDISREAARAQDSSRREAKLQSVYKDTAAKLEAALLDKAQSAREMDDLMSSLSTAEATLRSLRSAVDVEGHSALIAHASKRADDAEKALKELQLQHDSLQHSFAEERTSFAASESSVQQLRDRLQQVHDELDSAGSRCASLEAQLASARHSVDVANSENDRLRDSYRSKASDSNAAQALCDAATAKCHYLTEQLERKDETLAKQRKVTAELESRVASLTLSLRSAEDAKGIAEGNAKSLSTELAIASSRNGTLHGEVEMLRDQIKETTSVLHASGEERSLLQRKVSELQSSLQSSDMVVDALKSGERRLAAELELARSNLLEATEKLGVSQLQCQQLTSKVAEAERQLKTDARQRDAGDGLVSEWKSKLDSAMAEAKKRNATITELSDKLSRAIAERDGLEIQSRFAQSLSKQLEAQVEELRQSLSSGEEERMAAIEKVKHLEQSLEDADDRLAAATRRIEMLCAEKDASANRASDAVQQRTSLIDRLKQLEAEKAELSVLCANGQQGMQATLVSSS